MYLLLSGTPTNPQEKRDEMERETCLICFQSYLTVNTKEHQCEFSCGACGELCDENEGTLVYIGIEASFTHSAKLCAAQDELTNEDIHLAILEDFSNVIAKHLPNFDNNISSDVWKMLEVFTDEAIYQLTKENN